MSQSKKGVFSVFKQEGNQRQAPFYCRWTEDEDKLLYDAVQLHGPHKWSLIARHVPGRTPVQCSTRWLGALNPHVHKGRWSKEEDEALTAAVRPYLNNNNNKSSSLPLSSNSSLSASSVTSASETEEDNLPWSKIALHIPNRTGIQCQARWTEALDPSVRKGRWKKEEDDLLKIGVERYGCCWIRVAGFIPGRTQRQCRTRWNQIQSKRQKKSTINATATTPTVLAIQQQHTSTKKLAVKTEQPKPIQHKKKSEHSQEILQWKTYSTCKGSMEEQLIKPIQLSATPYILLNEQMSSVSHTNSNAAASPISNAIVIPSDIQSPLQSPSTVSSGLSSMDEDEFTENSLDDYFHSLTDVIKVEGYNDNINHNKTTNNNLSAMDAVQLLDNFDNMALPTTAPTTTHNESLLNHFLYDQQPDPLSFLSLYEFLQSPTAAITTTAALPSLMLDSYINIPNSCTTTTTTTTTSSS